jgi:hypothetical protein
MYTNIDTTHALSQIATYLRSPDFIASTISCTVDALIDGLTIVMRHSLFKFNIEFFLQLTGTAMGTPPAPPYATLYYYLHKRNLIPRYYNIVYYIRYLDDSFYIWDIATPDSSERLTEFQSDFDKFGNLCWDFTLLSADAIFLDLRLRINTTDSTTTITTTIYEKALNLHLYIPPASLHTSDVLKSTIHGHVDRANHLCSDPTDRKNSLRDLMLHLR